MSRAVITTRRRSSRPGVGLLALAGAGLLAAPASAPAAQAAAPQAPAPQTPAPTAAPAASSALPSGPGREVVVRVCSACHSPDIVATQRHDAQGWADVVQLMASRGANASEDDFNAIIDYLARSFPAPSTSVPTQGAHPPST